MPAGYQLCEDKVVSYKKHKSFAAPASWRTNSRDVEMPSDALLEILVAERPSVAPLRPEQEQDFEFNYGGDNCPAGQAYYEVVVVEVNPNSELYKKGKVTVVIFCKEQILNRNESQTRPIIGWPTGAIRISPVGVPDSLEPQVAGVWATIDDEVAHLSAAGQCGTINEESPGQPRRRRQRLQRLRMHRPLMQQVSRRSHHCHQCPPCCTSRLCGILREGGVVYRSRMQGVTEHLIV